ncbi:MAG TPA: SUKH-4 family immunity protein [Flavobacteriales bacterium]|nr:SUKH-4 family immunity protein [Flavobacteriales bacterium]
MTPQEFKARWGSEGEPCITLGSERVRRLSIKASTAEFLSIAGLPQSAAPFLSFGEPKEESSPFGLKLSEVFDHLDEEFERFIVIGFDGSGNPIAIDTQNDDQVVWLDHEDDFKDTYMNSSIAALGTFLLGYRDFVQDLLNAKGDDAFLNGNYEDDELEKLRQKLALLDSRALDADNFWNHELGTLKANQGSR